MADEPTGLGSTPKSAWPKLKKNKDILELMTPNSVTHNLVREYLLKRIRFSEEKMSNHYRRWQIAELKSQAYIQLSDYEQAMKIANQDKGKPPKAVSIIVPISYAITSTIVTYLLQVFAGRRPIFPVSSNKPETAEAANLIEQVLQYNADHARFLKNLYQFLTDGQVYGVSVLKTMWTEEKKKRTRFVGEAVTRDVQTTYQGNMVESIDPFMFFPDPRVPMVDVGRRGEFVFWRTFEGKHTLKKLEQIGEYFHVDACGRQPPDNEGSEQRSRLVIAGDSVPGRQGDSNSQFYTQIDQGTIEIIPRELGLGEGEWPEKWQFTIGNKQQIIQATPFEHDHDSHPVSVSEPYQMGYGHGQPSMVDLVGPLQDLISWFLNSHVDNVRKTLNDMFVVDPTRIEIQDLKTPEPGKLIRLKAPILGQDMRAAIQQLQVQDVTAGHVNDVQELIRITQMLSAVNDNTMGIQQAGGRKTATEVRTALEAGASRLSALARIVSAQAFVDLREQMCYNIQQFQDQEFWINVNGSDGVRTPLQVQPDMLVGDFNFPVHDGTMPFDKVALLDVWKEIFSVTAADPELMGRYDRGKIFEFMAELGGARNLESMRVQGTEQVMDGALSGELKGLGPVPLPGLGGPMNGQMQPALTTPVVPGEQ